MQKLRLGMLDHQKWFEITQLGIISHDKISWTLFTLKLVQNKSSQLINQIYP
jgi:hypothetical protein